jgi:hypothetical protein
MLHAHTQVSNVAMQTGKNLAMSTMDVAMQT